jgi:4-amino-4-deoxy-L-arabinose transferase-like glycosyltransferase
LISRSQRAKPWWVAPAAVLVVALAVRVGFVLATGGLHLENDPADYERLATSIAHGHGFGSTVVAPGGGPTAFRPPLYPLALGALYALVGVHVLAARLAQAGVGVVGVALLGVVAWQLFGRRVALVGMAVFAVYPPTILATSSLLSESLALPLELGAIALVLAGRRSAGSWRWDLGAGFLAGLGILNRPNSAVLVVPLVLLALVGRRVTRKGLIGAGLLVLAAILTTVPWLVRDTAAFDQFVPLTTQSGLVAAGTYNSESAHDGHSPAAWRPPTPGLVPEYARFLRGTEPAEEHLLDTAAKDYVIAHPTYPARVALWNTLRLFELTGPSASRASWQAVGFGSRAADVAFWSFVVIALFAVAGVCTRAARSAPWSFWLAPFLLIAGTVFLLGESRLRATIDPFVLCLTALGVVALLERISARRAGPRLVAAPASATAEAPIPVS